MTDDEWRSAIEFAALARPVPVAAYTYVQKWDTWSLPRVLATRSGTEYVVKMCQHGRSVMGGAIFTECLAGKLGDLIEAAVAPVELIEVSQTLIDINPELALMMPGLAHGSLRVHNVSERGPSAFLHTSMAENRKRFALFAVFYGWIGLSCDYQFFYQNFPPEVVYSFDHGFSFGQIQMLTHRLPWDVRGFLTCPVAVPDGTIMAECCLAPAELYEAIEHLRLATDDDIATAVSVPPDEWGVSVPDRVYVAAHLSKRRDTLLRMIP